MEKSHPSPRTFTRVYVENDASLVEINPLVLTKGGDFVAGDAALNVDDNALYRHPKLKDLLDKRVETNPIEKKAHKHGFGYVRLDGSLE